MSMRSVNRVGLSVACAAVLVAAIAGPAAAAGGQTKVTGLLTPDTEGVCTADVVSFGTYKVSGTLSGCWYITEWTIHNETPSGAELFIGWLGDRQGEFTTEYTYTYKIVNGALVHGRCHHPITGDSGGFATASGVLQMHDLPNGTSTYTGQLSF